MQISCAVVAQLISALVFAIWIVQAIYYLNPKFQASSHLMWLYSPVCVAPGWTRKPLRPLLMQVCTVLLTHIIYYVYAETKMQISCAVAAQLISALVFAIRIVQSLYYLNPKFQASSHLMFLYSPVCVAPGRKPLRPLLMQVCTVLLTHICICGNKDADQLRSICAADQRLCFRYTEKYNPSTT